MTRAAPTSPDPRAPRPGATSRTAAADEPDGRLLAGFVVGLFGSCLAALVIWLGLTFATARWFSEPGGDGSASVVAYPGAWLARLGLFAALMLPALLGAGVMHAIARRVSLVATLVLTVVYGVVFVLPMLEIGVGASGGTVAEAEQPLATVLGHPVSFMLAPVVFFGLPLLAGPLAARLSGSNDPA
jgi:hypothetical protein